MWYRVVYDTLDLHAVSSLRVDDEGSMLFRNVGKRHILEGSSLHSPQ